MVIQFTPHSDEYFEEESEKLRFEEGEYQFEIINAVEKKSKSDKPMIELEVAIYHQDGRNKVIKDWIVMDGLMAWKLKRVCQSINKEKIWESGSVYAEDLKNGVGSCVVKLKPSQNDKDKKFLSVDRYLPRNTTQSSYQQDGQISINENIAPPIVSLDDDIPF